MRSHHSVFHAEDGWRASVEGYCSETPERLLHLYRQGQYQSVCFADGDFVALIEGPDERAVVSSSYGIKNWFVTEVKGHLFHGPTVLDVAESANLPWIWNPAAVSRFIEDDHTHFEETFHRDISRLPARTVIRQTRLGVSRITLPFDEFKDGPATSNQDVLEAFNTAVQRWGGDDAVVGLSAGRDSRVVLSAFLAAGQRPLTVVAGAPGARDVIIAQQLASIAKLDLEVVELEPDWVEDHIDEIVRVTSGTKAANHWHTFQYPRRSRFLQGRTMITGNNGEFVRSWEWVPPIARFLVTYSLGMDRLLLAKYFEKQYHSPLASVESHYAEPLRRTCEPEQRLAFRDRLIRDVCANDLRRGLDLYLLNDRMPHFHGNGRALVEASAGWRAPFLCRDWVRTAWRLPFWGRSGSRWHHFAVAQNAPALLQAPISADGSPMSPTVSMWTALTHVEPKGGGMAPYDEWFSKPKWLDIALDLDIPELFAPGFPDAVRDTLRLGTGRLKPERVVFKLLPIATMARLIRDSEQRRREAGASCMAGERVSMSTPTTFHRWAVQYHSDASTWTRCELTAHTEVGVWLAGFGGNSPNSPGRACARV